MPPTPSFQKFMDCLSDKDIHPVEYNKLATYASDLKAAERDSAIDRIGIYLLTNIRDKRLPETIEALQSEELKQLYLKYLNKPAPAPVTIATYTKTLLNVLQGYKGKDLADNLDRLLMMLKREDGKDLVQKKAILEMIRQLPQTDNIDLRFQYFLGWSKNISFVNEGDLLDLMDMHAVTSKVAVFSKQALKLNFIDHQLDHVYLMSNCHLYGNVGYKNRPLLPQEKEFEYPDFKAKELYTIAFTGKGKNQIGGEIPAGFEMPKNIGRVPFDYIGRISKEENAFNWLPFDINIVCPILLDNFEVVFLDYSKPLQPELLNREVLEKCSYQEAIPPDFNRSFKPHSFALTKTFITNNPTKQRAAGVPEWIQSPVVLKSPVNGKTMKLVLQLFSNHKIKTTQKSNLPYGDSFNFWIDGCFYLFFEPESKVAGMLIQNT